MEAAESLRDFIGDIDAVGNDCGVNIISDNFNADIEKNGLSWIITNIFWHIADIEAKALDALENLVLENWEVAGKSMGEIINYIAPPQANQLSLNSFEPESITDFALGVLSGLEGSSTSGPCYTEVQPGVVSFGALMTDLWKLIAKSDLDTFQQLLNDAKTFKAELASFDSSKCDFEGMVKAVQSSTVTSIAQNYFTNQSALDADFASIKKCAADLTTCGEALGASFSLLFSWSLN